MKLGPCSSAGHYVLSVAAGDLDGDARADLVTIGQFGNTVYVQFGNGDGTFQSPLLLPISGDTQTLAVADINGDGKPGIVVGTSNGVAVLLNAGNGTFQDPVYYLTGSVQAVAVADLNGDKIPDIAAGLSPGISILVGASNGSFTTGPTLTLPTQTARAAASVAIADFNRDGYPDILACTLFFPGLATAYLFQGTGSGAFASPSVLHLPGASEYVTAGYVNGDGKPDFVAVTANVRNIAVFFGNGDGTFTPPKLYAVKPAASAAVLAPLRRPGVLDIEVASVGGWGISVLLNRGNGSYTDALVEPVGGGGTLAVADFNQDGKPDVAVQAPPASPCCSAPAMPNSPFRPART